MKNTVLIIAVIVGTLLSVAGAGSLEGDFLNPPDWSRRKEVSFSDLKRNFDQPDMHYAPFMFWFWDEPLNSKKMAEMSAKIASQRINPGYAHPRTTALGVSPLNPLPKEQWLSNKWFESFDAALSQAEKAGTYLGYCDEYMWPSLQLGGKIAAERLSWTILGHPYKTGSKLLPSGLGGPVRIMVQEK